MNTSSIFKQTITLQTLSRSAFLTYTLGKYFAEARCPWGQGASRPIPSPCQRLRAESPPGTTCGWAWGFLDEIELGPEFPHALFFFCMFVKRAVLLFLLRVRSVVLSRVQGSCHAARRIRVYTEFGGCAEGSPLLHFQISLRWYFHDH